MFRRRQAGKRGLDAAAVAAAALVLSSCGQGSGAQAEHASRRDRSASASVAGRALFSFKSAGVRLEVSQVAGGLDTVWSLAWDPSGALWYTERPGRLTKLGERPEAVDVEEVGEGGLMGLEIDARGRKFVMHTGPEDNRVVRIDPDGTRSVLVRGIAKADFHNGGRLRFGPDGMLYATTGDASNRGLADDPTNLNGKVLRIDPDTGATAVWSRGHRNSQGLCFAPDGRLLATEHGPDGDDEVNVLSQGFDGGWPATTGNGIKNYPSSVAPAGCVVYGADRIRPWRGSMLFGTLVGESLRRLSFRPDGSVAGEEVLLAGELGRLRDVGVGPDGAVYLATSNRDQRGRPRPGDDRILRIAPR